MIFQVKRIGEEPPALEVECLECHARPGVPCRSVHDGSVLEYLHPERWITMRVRERLL
jgi:hypothetical protein